MRYISITFYLIKINQLKDDHGFENNLSQLSYKIMDAVRLV